MLDHGEILDARILIVDDQESNVLLLEQLLHESGYTCVSSTEPPRVSRRLFGLSQAACGISA